MNFNDKICCNDECEKCTDENGYPRRTYLKIAKKCISFKEEKIFETKFYQGLKITSEILQQLSIYIERILFEDWTFINFQYLFNFISRNKLDVHAIKFISNDNKNTIVIGNGRRWMPILNTDYSYDSIRSYFNGTNVAPPTPIKFSYY